MLFCLPVTGAWDLEPLRSDLWERRKLGVARIVNLYLMPWSMLVVWAFSETKCTCSSCKFFRPDEATSTGSPGSHALKSSSRCWKARSWISFGCLRSKSEGGVPREQYVLFNAHTTTCMALIKAWERKLLGKGNGNSAVEGALGPSRRRTRPWFWPLVWVLLAAWLLASVGQLRISLLPIVGSKVEQRLCDLPLQKLRGSSIENEEDLREGPASMQLPTDCRPCWFVPASSSAVWSLTALMLLSRAASKIWATLCYAPHHQTQFSVCTKASIPFQVSHKACVAHIL